MRAVLFQPGEGVLVRDVPRPACAPGGALVRVRACGICGSDLHVLRGAWPTQPFWVGHEIAGEVLEVQDGGDFQPGDHVAIEPIAGCGRCRFCESGDYVHCSTKRFIGGSIPGGYADYLDVPSARLLHRLPADLPWEVGALAEPLAVGVHALRRAGLQGGMSVAVVGGGAIGLLALQAARALGAHQTAVLAKYEHQAALARRLGASTTALTSDPEAIARLVDAADGGYDLVVEAVGGASTAAQQALDLVRPLGIVALTGAFPAAVPLALGQVVSKEVRLIGANCYSASLEQRRDFAIAVALLARGEVDGGALITHRFPLDQAAEAFATALDKGSGVVKATLRTERPVITPTL